MYEMQVLISDPRHGKPNYPTDTVREVFALSYKKTVKLAITSSAGTAAKLVRTILDFDPRRQEPSGRVRGQSPTDHEKLLRSVTSFRKAQRQSFTDPLLWVHGVRWSVREAALAPDYIQPEACGTGHYAIPERLPKNASGYYSLALRSFGCLRSQSSYDQLCDQLRHRLRLAETGRSIPSTSPIPDNTTSHWFLWYLAARYRDREKAFHTLRTANFL